MKRYPIIPCAAPRMTQADKWKRRECVLKYFAFRDDIKRHNVQFANGQAVTFIIPFPASYGKKKRNSLLDEPHTLKPDIDNLIKAFLDSLYENDCHISEIHAFKRWGDNGAIIVQDCSYVLS